MQKKFFFIFSIFLLADSVATAQFRKVPAVVTDAFKIKYPDATEVSWSDKISSFQASFLLYTERLEADFTSKGIWKKAVRELDTAHLPQDIVQGFKESKYYTGWHVLSAIETLKDDLTYEYRLFIQKSALQKKYLYFSATGKLLREVITL